MYCSVDHAQFVNLSTFKPIRELEKATSRSSNLLRQNQFVLYSLVESKLVCRPVNTAVVQGSAVTFECVSDVSKSIIHWYNSLCVTNNVATCTPTDYIYDSFSSLVGKYRSSQRFSVTEVHNATHVTRNVNIKSTQLSDAGVYLCVEFVGADILQLSSAQLIVLGMKTLSSLSSHEHVV